MTGQPSGRLPRALLGAALAASLALIGIGLAHHWNLALPLVGVGRLSRWVLLGIYSSGPVLAVGAALARLAGWRPAGADGTIRIAVWWAGGWLVVVAIGLTALATGTYSALIWQVLAPLVWLALLGWQIATRWSGLRSAVHAVRRSTEIQIPLRSWRTLMVLIAVTAALHASLPPDTRDELSYHLVMPELWSQQGDWWVPVDNFHLAFPGNCELMWGWAAALAGLRGPRFITLVFAVLTVALLAAWMTARGFPAWIRHLSLVFLVVTPVALTAASICYVEWPLLFFVLLGWRLSRVFLDRTAPAAAVGAAVCWGMAAGIKYTAILFVALLALEWIATLWRLRRSPAALCAAVGVAASALLLAGPWYLRNLTATGDPVYPLGSALGFAADTDVDPQVLSRYADLDGLWRWAPWLYHATADTIGDHRLHPAWPMLHLAVLGLGWRWRRQLPWFTVLMATAVLAWFTPAPRIYLPLMLLVWLFLPQMMADFLKEGRERALATAVVALMAVVSLPTALHFMFAPGGRAVADYMLGASSVHRYLTERGLMGPASAWVAANTSPDARIWAWCEDRVLYLERWTRSDSPYGPPAFLSTVESGGTAALDAALARDAMDYVLIRRDRCPQPWGTAVFEKRSWTIHSDTSSELDLWIASRLDELRRDDRHILYRVRR